MRLLCFWGSVRDSTSQIKCEGWVKYLNSFNAACGPPVSCHEVHKNGVVKSGGPRIFQRQIWIKLSRVDRYVYILHKLVWCQTKQFPTINKNSCRLFSFKCYHLYGKTSGNFTLIIIIIIIIIIQAMLFLCTIYTDDFQCVELVRCNTRDWYHHHICNYIVSKKKFHMKCADMFMIHLHTKFQVASYNH
jgi:hypothetical protein